MLCLLLRCLLLIETALDIEGLLRDHLNQSQIELWDHQGASRIRATSSRTLCRSEMPNLLSGLCEGPKATAIFQLEYMRLGCLSSSSEPKKQFLYHVQSLTSNKLGKDCDRFDQSLIKALRNKPNHFLDSFPP